MQEPLVTARGLTVLASSQPVVRALDLDVGGGFLGVVGPNGAGKSTLLHVLAGLRRPDAGVVVRKPAAQLVLVAQGVEEPDERVRALSAEWDRPALRWRTRLALPDNPLERWQTLSPGERRRWQLGAALWAPADVLLLDEPSNHLDGAARTLVVDALRGFRGACVIVSHDRALLDALTSRTVILEGGSALVVESSVTGALRVADERRRSAAAARADHVSAVTRARAQLGDARHVAHETERSRSARTRMRNRHDSDSRGVGAQFVADRAASKRSREVAVARARLARAADALAALDAGPRTFGRALTLPAEPIARARLCALDIANVRVCGAPVVGERSVVVKRASRVWIDGDNGTGKSTLLAAVAAAAGDVQGLFMLQQDLSHEDEAQALEGLHALPLAARGHALQLLAALGVDPGRLCASQHPSVGEARKILIASALAMTSPALLLDEPTNHIDLPSVSRLEAALCAYQGALLVVSHDAAFAQRSDLRERWHLKRKPDGTHELELGSVPRHVSAREHDPSEPRPRSQRPWR